MGVWAILDSCWSGRGVKAKGYASVASWLSSFPIYGTLVFFQRFKKHWRLRFEGAALFGFYQPFHRAEL